MKIHILGTCSGTEPMPGRHHVSFAVEHRGGLYWFDAGECCSYTAHIMGLDLMQIRAIFISHTHMDHIGGLGNLLWTIRKLDGITHRLQNRDIPLYIPEPEAWEGIRMLLSHTEGGFACDFAIHAQAYGDGLLLEREGLTVTALHNHHLPHEEGAPWRSFGFRISAEGKNIVYSGDTGSIEEALPLMEDCHMLLMETGHHHPTEVAQRLKEAGRLPGHLAFIHHGRDILQNPAQQLSLLREALGDRVSILEDAVTLTI